MKRVSNSPSPKISFGHVCSSVCLFLLLIVPGHALIDFNGNGASDLWEKNLQFWKSFHRLAAE